MADCGILGATISLGEYKAKYAKLNTESRFISTLQNFYA